MQTSTLWLVLILMATLMMTLTWVGLRYFCPSAEPVHRPKPAPKEARREARLRWPQLRLATFLTPFKSRQTLWLLASLLLVAFTVTLTLAFSGYINPPAMTGEDMGPTGDVGNILREEVLVPPQPLPPSLFIGTESYDLEHADRDWSKLDARFRNTVLQLFAKMEARGFQMALLEGYRSSERQELLAKKGPSVTQARGGQSKHQYGFAADIAPMRDNRLMISDRDPWAASAYRALGEEAGKLGLVWGGAWAMRDLGHVESPGKTSSLAQQTSS